MPTTQPLVKETRLLLNEHERKAVREGRKTQFRVPLEPQPEGDKIWYEPEYPGGAAWVSSPLDSKRTVWRCPFGQVGDHIWVAEPWPKWAARLWLEIVDVRVERDEGVWSWAISFKRLEGAA